MGAHNVRSVYERWAHLNHRPFRMLAHMAVTSLDERQGTQAPREYFGSRELLANAIGRTLPSKTDAAQDVGCRKARNTTLKEVRTDLAYLIAAGAIERVNTARTGNRAVYLLTLRPPVEEGSGGASERDLKVRRGGDSRCVEEGAQAPPKEPLEDGTSGVSEEGAVPSVPHALHTPSDQPHGPGKKVALQDSNAGLARYFEEQMRESFDLAGMAPGQFLKRALLDTFTGWKEQGVSAAQIRALIDVFCASKPRPTKSLTYAFIDARHVNWTKAKALLQQTELDEERWDALPPTTYDYAKWVD